ncbi:RNA helicase, partial [Cupriavidus basilensis]|nr:RNA helicase [Cupriavidus basilensis]
AAGNGNRNGDVDGNRAGGNGNGNRSRGSDANGNRAGGGANGNSHAAQPRTGQDAAPRGRRPAPQAALLGGQRAKPTR